MISEDKQNFIQEMAVANEYDLEGERIYWSRHAITEAVNDSLTRQEVEAALTAAEIIEDYPVKRRPLPDCLVLTFLPDERPLHAVVAIDQEKERIFIVTVYLPSKEKWHDDWRTRK